MSRQPAEPTTAAPDSSTASGPKQSARLTKQQARMKLYTGVINQSQKNPKALKRRQPSLPKLPWNDA